MPNEVINRIVHINYVQWLMLFYLLPKSCVFNPFFCSVFVNNFVFAHIRMGGFQCDSIAKIKDEHWTHSTVVLILDMLNVCKAAIYTGIIICFVATTLSDCKSSIFVYFWIQFISVKYYAFYKRKEFLALAKSSFYFIYMNRIILDAICDTKNFEHAGYSPPWHICNFIITFMFQRMHNFLVSHFLYQSWI